MGQTYQKPLLAAPSFGSVGNVASPDAVGPAGLTASPLPPTSGPRVLTGRSPDVLAMLALVTKLQHDVHSLTRQRDRLIARCGELDEEVRNAARLQRELLPPTCHVRGAGIQLLYRPLERLSGDVYDIRRIDDHRVAISLIDAVGHGAAAAMLASAIQAAFRECRAADPAEVLTRVNRGVIDYQLQQGQFAAVLHAVYDERRRTLRFARGGAPFPILVRAGRAPERLAGEGAVLGALEDAEFETVTVQLERADRVFLFSDGLEALLVERTHGGRLESVTESAWYGGLRSRSTEDALDALAEMLGSLPSDHWPADDVTAIALTAAGNSF